MDRLSLQEAFGDDAFIGWLSEQIFRHVPPATIRQLAKMIVLEKRLLKQRDIMQVLKEHGVTVSLKNGKLVAAPAKKVTPEIGSLIRVYRPEILDALVPHEAKTPERKP